MHKKVLLVFSAFIFLWSCKSSKEWEGQEEIKKVSTQTVPVQWQYKGTFDLGDGIYFSNDFDGARLNGITRINDTLITALITPENTPVNMSPWYAFKVWSDTERQTSLQLTYHQGARHRYFPKISTDGINWKNINSANYELNSKIVNNQQVPHNATMKLLVSPDTLWVAAQELTTSAKIDAWTNDLSSLSFVTKTKIGESHEGKAIDVLKIGESDDKAMVVVLSRQHPPEVTGFQAMESFVETISSESEIAEDFRNQYNTYVFPLVNPDGVDRGHWRHNFGGIDLNRDWEDFNQPETSAIKQFIEQKVAASEGKIYFFVDFHSTWNDIYYTFSEDQKGNMPGLVPELIAAIGKELPNYEPNIKPSPELNNKVTSISYFFYKYGAESITYEIGDNTSRDFIKKKGEVTAIKLMELMMTKQKN